MVFADPLHEEKAAIVHTQFALTADVFVDAAGIIYSTDYNGGLYVMEFQG
jgi:hypothetical protein